VGVKGTVLLRMGLGGGRDAKRGDMEESPSEGTCADGLKELVTKKKKVRGEKERIETEKCS